MDLKLLRDATRHEHEATEAAVPLMQPGLTRQDYVSVLQRFHRVVSAWEDFAAANAPSRFVSLVAARRRAPSLVADLRNFGAAPQQSAPEVIVSSIRNLVGPPGAAPSAEADARFLGAMYVLEGSTLGGRFIAAHLETALGLTPGEGDLFFRGYGDETMPMWREFQDTLRGVPEEQGATVIESARGMFGIFQREMSGNPAIERVA